MMMFFLYGGFSFIPQIKRLLLGHAKMLSKTSRFGGVVQGETSI